MSEYEYKNVHFLKILMTFYISRLSQTNVLLIETHGNTCSILYRYFDW